MTHSKPPAVMARAEAAEKVCKKGLHELTPLSTYASNGACKACARIRGRQYREENRESRRAQQAEYRAANRETARARDARNYVENGANIRAWHTANYQENREVILERNARYRAANREAINRQKVEYATRLRYDVLDHYGHQCVCCRISTSDRFLSLDHITGGGADHRRTLKMSGGAQFHKWLRDNDYPTEYQVLCWSCNGAKRQRPACPHLEPVIPRTANQRYRRKLKLEVIEAYGSRCACCDEDGLDFLHLDHINGGGKLHRKSLASNPSDFYPTLRKLGFPNDPPLRVLCGNCNHAVRFGTCPHQLNDGLAN